MTVEGPDQVVVDGRAAVARVRVGVLEEEVTRDGSAGGLNRDRAESAIDEGVVIDDEVRHAAAIEGDGAHALEYVAAEDQVVVSA
jgi:hypothetical protein